MLTFSLEPPAPAGAEINPVNGLFQWKPAQSQALNSYLITVRVTDNGKPNRSATGSFTVTVGQHPLAPRVGSVFVEPGGVTIRWNGIVGRTYRVQFKNSLGDPAWIDLGPDLTAETSELSIVDVTAEASRERYYRLLLME